MILIGYITVIYGNLMHIVKKRLHLPWTQKFMTEVVSNIKLHVYEYEFVKMLLLTPAVINFGVQKWVQTHIAHWIPFTPAIAGSGVVPGAF